MLGVGEGLSHLMGLGDGLATTLLLSSLSGGGIFFGFEEQGNKGIFGTRKNSHNRVINGIL